jgi:hypothetical protein
VAGGLSLAQPACGNICTNGDGAFGQAFASSAATPPPLELANRLSNDVCVEVFGVHPWLCFGGIDIAAQTLAATPAVGGVAILRGDEEQDGFQGWAENQRDLRAAGGEVNVLYSQPEKAGYTLQGERPAQYDQLIAVQPATFSGAQSVWVTFHGIGGSVDIDSSNLLTVKWEGGTWTKKLPGGVWQVLHPAAGAVKPNDVVLVKHMPLPQQLQPGAAPS